ncbi:MAG TPA: alkaline phosphatase [Verrucomicrobiae bacterium]|jgi:predicted AlkP superfamily pyrophosphatase or phosphodiesterase|nr:alkaline phosphatase [Verrucomicrobiae bacterium]
MHKTKLSRLKTANLLLIAFLAFIHLPIRAQIPGVEHVVIIGCDGMSPDGVRKAKTPVMKRLMKEGAYTLHARGVMPTSSSPNWASMIMGAGPEQHGVTSNDWETNKFEIEPIARGIGPMFPTIFGELHRQRPQAVIACFHDWDGFGRLFERQAANKIENPIGPTNTALHAIDYIKEQKPAFTFIHFDHVDHAGHHSGHGTPDYYAAVDVADKLISTILEGIQDAGISEHTIVLVTADHGGVGTKHGAATMAELEIPWILYGPGVKRGHEITTPIDTYDTAVTVAYIFGVRPHPAWIGKPIVEAFEK